MELQLLNLPWYRTACTRTWTVNNIGLKMHPAYIVQHKRTVLRLHTDADLSVMYLMLLGFYQGTA